MKNLKLTTYLLVTLTIGACTDLFMGNEGSIDEDIYLNYESITDLALPFDEEWTVFLDGGKTHSKGGDHFISRGLGQRYAYDFFFIYDTIINGNTVSTRYNSFNGNGQLNLYYYAYSKDVKAPAEGIVVAIENTITENVPGVRNTTQPRGNYVEIDHLNGETSVLSHLKQWSIQVRVGQSVSKGQIIAQVGNSGDSDAPHIHYQLQGTSGELKGLGLPASFLNYFEDNMLINRGFPEKGKSVSNN